MEEYVVNCKYGCNILPIPVCIPLGNITLLLPTPLEPARPRDLLWPMGY